MRLVSSLVLLAALVASPALAQGRLAFEAETLDFGRVVEVEGPVTHTFRFTNAGDAPLRLVRVEAACGCTTPTWTDADVAPGASGVVEVAYDPAGRPGPFEKTVFVQAAGAEPDAVTLRIEGIVQPALAQRGVRLGSLAFNTTDADAGLVQPGEPLQTAFQFANVGDRPVRVERVEAPEGVEVVMPSRPVFPDGMAGFFVSIEDPLAHLFHDTVIVTLRVFTTDPEMPVKTLRVRGRVVLR